jgi:hypothetical protein
MTVKKYTEEFYRLNIRVGHQKRDDEKVARYMNGLRYDIQDEMSMITIRMMKYDFQMAVKAEEKLIQKWGQIGRGISHPKGKSIAQDKNQKPKEDWKKPQTQTEKGGSSQRGKYAEQRGQHTKYRGDYVDTNMFPCTIGRGRGRGGVIT